jgi:hypothetical protein
MTNLDIEDKKNKYPRIVFRAPTEAYIMYRVLADDHYRDSLIKKPSVDLLAKYALEEYCKNLIRDRWNKRQQGQAQNPI